MLLHCKAQHVVDGLLFERPPEKTSKSDSESTSVLLSPTSPQRVAGPVHTGQDNVMLACAAANSVFPVALPVQRLIWQAMPAPNTGPLFPSRSVLAEVARELSKARGFTERLEERRFPQQGRQRVFYGTGHFVVNAASYD